VPEVAAAVRDLDLRCSVVAIMSDARDPIHPDPRVQQNVLAYLRRATDVLLALGGGPIVGAAYTAAGRVYPASPDQRKREFDLAVKHMRQAAAYAGDRNVVIAIEPLNRFESSFMSKTEIAVELVAAVDHPAIGVNLDTFHINIEERSFGETIERVGGKLYHVHACENDRGRPGSGHVPWGEVAEALGRIGYDRTIVIESFAPELEPIASAARIWHPFDRDMDTFARDGLAFLKRLLA
jgi:D-psicose/D-tagatose/L-ribulose 3-epimerase